MDDLRLNRRTVAKRLVFGALSGLGSAWGVLWNPGCRPESRHVRISGLTPEAGSLIAEIAETILPETDTPGARAAGVGPFVIRILKDCRTQADRDQIVRGLNEFEQECVSRFGRRFVQCTASEKRALVEEIDSGATGFWGKVESKLLRRRHYYLNLKELVLIGYFTSQQGATGALSYDALPGKWVGCFAMKPGQKSWATQ